MFSNDRAYRRCRLFAALSVLVPERTGRELGEIMPQLQKSPGFAGAFLEAIPWREGQHITQHAVAFIEELLELGDPGSATYSDADALIDRVLLVAAQPGHEAARYELLRLTSLEVLSRTLHQTKKTSFGNSRRWNRHFIFYFRTNVLN